VAAGPARRGRFRSPKHTPLALQRHASAPATRPPLRPWTAATVFWGGGSSRRQPVGMEYAQCGRRVYDPLGTASGHFLGMVQRGGPKLTSVQLHN
jgi:hypothetical protein